MESSINHILNEKTDGFVGASCEDPGLLGVELAVHHSETTLELAVAAKDLKIRIQTEKSKAIIKERSNNQKKKKQLMKRNMTKKKRKKPKREENKP